MTQTNPPVQVPFRDISVDLLRGFAIAVMVGANLIPTLLIPPAPFWLRLLASIAAPLFIFLSGMMVALSCRKKRHPLSYFLLRGGVVICLAALLDLCVWGFLPFMDFDVLYLIGISMPLAWIFLTLDSRYRLPVCIAVFALTPVLQGLLGYGGDPLQIPAIQALSGTGLPALPAILHGWLIDGWFPIFPWLAVALLGAHVGMFRWEKNDRVRSFVEPGVIRLASGAMVLGALVWYFWPGAALTPEGYVELFYPPTIGFLLFVSGLIIALFAIADLLVKEHFSLMLVQVMGQCSLAIYAIHVIILGWVINPLGIRVPLPGYLACYLIFISGMIGVAVLLRYIRLRQKNTSFLLRMIIGGCRRND